MDMYHGTSAAVVRSAGSWAGLWFFTAFAVQGSKYILAHKFGWIASAIKTDVEKIGLK